MGLGFLEAISEMVVPGYPENEEPHRGTIHPQLESRIQPENEKCMKFADPSQEGPARVQNGQLLGSPLTIFIARVPLFGLVTFLRL